LMVFAISGSGGGGALLFFLLSIMEEMYEVSASPAMRPMLRARIGGNTPYGFALSVNPKLSKSTAKLKCVIKILNYP
jgi:hypothetical protein